MTLYDIALKNLVLPLAYILLILVVARNNHLPKVIQFFMALTPAITLQLFILSYIIFYFVGGGINETIIYHLAVGFDGLDDYSDFYHLFTYFALVCIISILLTWLTYTFIMRINKKRHSAWFLIALPLGIILHPFMINIIQFWEGYNITPTKEDIAEFNALHDDIDLNAPFITSNAQTKDVVWLFVESLDDAYHSDQKNYPDLMPHLREIANNNRRFSRITQLDATLATIAGTTAAAQCGLPLVYRYNINDGDNFHYANMEKFLPSATCLGDIFQKAGYRNLFISADDPKFTYAQHFYQAHGFAQEDIFGKKEISSLMERPITLGSWGKGVFDSDLLDFSKMKFDALANRSEPFTLFIATLDTHRDDGFLNPLCNDLIYDQYPDRKLAKVIHCTDRSINDLYLFLKNHKSANNTILVIASDHILPSNAVINKSAPQNNTFIIVDFENETHQVIERLGSTLDTGITLIDYLQWDLNTLQFGKSLMDDTHKTLIEHYDAKNVLISEKFSQWGKLFSKFWRPNL